MPLDVNKIIQERNTGPQIPVNFDNKGFQASSNANIPSLQNSSQVQQPKKKSFIGKVAKGTGEFALGAGSQMYSFAGNLAGGLIKLTKYVNPNDLGAALGIDTPEIFRSQFLGEKLQKAGQKVTSDIQRSVTSTSPLEMGSSVDIGGKFTNIVGTIATTLAAPKFKQLNLEKYYGNSGYMLGKMRNFALNQTARATTTLQESAIASTTYGLGAVGRPPTLKELKNNAKFDIGMQLALGTLASVARPVLKGATKLVTGIGDDAVENLADKRIAGKVKKAIAGEFDITPVREAAEEAHKQIQPLANEAYENAMKTYIPNSKNITLAKQYKLNLLKNIDDGMKDRIGTLTDSQIKEVDRLKNIIVNWSDNSIDGWRQLSIKMGNEIKEAMYVGKVADNFGATKFIIDDSIDDILNLVTNNGWNKVNEVYKPYKELQTQLKPLVSGNKTTIEGFLRMAGKDSIDRKVLRQYFKQLDDLTGSNILPDIDALTAARQFDQGTGIVGNYVAGLGLGKPVGQILASIIPAINNVKFSNYMAVPIGLTKKYFIPFDQNTDPVSKRLERPREDFNSQGANDFGINL